MADIPGYVAPIVGGLFFVVSAIVGACLYCFYFKTRKAVSEQGSQTTNSFKRNFGVANPFAFYLAGVSPIEFSSGPCTIETKDERSFASKCYVPEEHWKLPEKARVCRSTSYDKPLRSPCHLQVIRETEEENEEETNGCSFNSKENTVEEVWF